MKAKQTNILMIGPLPPPLGGTTVLFQQLISDLNERKDVKLSIVNTAGIRSSGWLCAYVLLQKCFEISIKACKVDVISVHASTSGLGIIGSICLLIAKCCHKPLIVRKFGGVNHNSGHPFWAFLIRWVLRNSIFYLAETKILVEEAKNENLTNARWYPNSRPKITNNGSINDLPQNCSRFIYLGQVRPTKGIREIITTDRTLPDHVSIDVYGPLMDGITEAEFKNTPKVEYCGVVEPQRVHSLLESYDALILPTYHEGEGYPGVILEAYHAGLPVICTKWKALPEIVDVESGLLIDPKSSDQLAAAIIQMHHDIELWKKLKRGTVKKSDFFDSQRWTNYFIELCNEAISTKQNTPKNHDKHN